MYGLKRKSVLTGLLSLLLIMSGVSQADVNPFKKSKNYKFGTSEPWYENAGAVIKSGSDKDGSNTNYFHLNITRSRLLLRLGKNDPSGEKVNTRLLDSLAITDVLVDGRRLPLFDWCLQNQRQPTRKLKQNTVVVNDVCVNAGGGGDFIINLDEQSRNLFKNAKLLEFIVEPYGRPVKLSYTMAGYATLMAKIEKPVVVKAARPKPKPKPKKLTPAPQKVKPIVVKTCETKPPVTYQASVAAVSYPCNDAVKKSNAEKQVADRVVQEKNKIAAKRQAEKLQQLSREQSAEDTKREEQWDKQQTAMWLGRCKRNWKKGSSPCYCEKYLDQAPAGVKSTCGK